MSGGLSGRKPSNTRRGSFNSFCSLSWRVLSCEIDSRDDRLLKPLHFIERIKTFEEGVETYDTVFCGRDVIIKSMNLGGDATVNCVSWRSTF